MANLVSLPLFSGIEKWRYPRTNLFVVTCLSVQNYVRYEGEMQSQPDKLTLLAKVDVS